MCPIVVQLRRLIGYPSSGAWLANTIIAYTLAPYPTPRKKENVKHVLMVEIFPCSNRIFIFKYFFILGGRVGRGGWTPMVSKRSLGSNIFLALADVHRLSNFLKSLKTKSLQQKLHAFPLLPSASRETCVTGQKTRLGMLGKITYENFHCTLFLHPLLVRSNKR